MSPFPLTPGRARRNGGVPASAGAAAEKMPTKAKLHDVAHPSEVQRLPAQDVQALWFATLRRPWSVLVVVPADRHAPAQQVGRALGEFGGRHRGRPLLVTSTAGLDLGDIANLVAGIEGDGRDGPSYGARAIIVLDPVDENPMGIAAAMVADAALLCIQLGQSSIAAALHAIEQVGADKFIGCAAIHPGR